MAAATLPAAGALTARGVAGEVRATPLQTLLLKHGGEVPHYDYQGQQHYRVPFKDKSYLAGVQERSEWLHKPKHRTRTELLEARRAARCPDISYDVDGDGAVGPADYFIGKTFGRERDHRLNTGERDQVVHALENGWLDKLSFGHEQAGAKRSMGVRQLRGKIFTADTAAQLNEVYPPHWNAGKTPQHPTLTDLKNHRTAELRQSADILRDQWEAKNPMTIPQPPVIQDFSVSDPPMTHISQRTEAFKSAAREDAGLDSATVGVNPFRETLEMGLGWRDAPEFATRTSLQEARRARLQEDATATRLRGERDFVPVEVVRTMRHHADYEGRRADPEAMTLTKLSARRRQERIEHNMTHFTPIPPEPARFSDQDKSWWTLRDGYCPDPPTSLLKELRDVPETVAPKVTEVKPPRPRGASSSRAAPPPAAPEVAGFGALGELGQAGGRRWSSECVPTGSGAKQKRLFDDIKQAPTLATDSVAMHTFSSFEVIRREGAREDAERQQQTAREDEDRALAWKDYVRRGPAVPKHDDAEPSVAVAPPPDEVSAPETKSQRPSMIQIPHLPLEAITTRLNEPLGEDLPMTERLGLLTSRTTARVEQDTPKANNGRSSSVMTTGRPKPSESPLLRAAHERAPSVAASAATPAPAPPPVPVPPPTQMVVRSGGFQWLDRHRAAQRLEEPSIAPSLRRTPQDPSLLPPSLRRTPQASLRNLGSEGMVSRTHSRLQADVQSNA